VIRFECTLCGDCCTGAQVVRLSGGDLAPLVYYLGLSSVKELRTAGVVELVQERVGEGWVWRPRLRFRTHPLRQCPFLVNDVNEGRYRGLCSLHPHHKPLVCRLSPLSRTVDDPGQGQVHEQWSVVPPVEGCPGMGRGPELAAAAPPELKGRLAAEVEWMRKLIGASPGLSLDQAWEWLAGEGAS